MNRKTAFATVLSLSLLAALGSTDRAMAQSCINYVIGSATWGPPIKESAGIEFVCPGDSVITGMQHSGDENGNTSYLCGTLSPQPVSPVQCTWSQDVKESNGYFTCTDNQVLTGRKHTGDENGPTKYRCCDLQLAANGTTVPVDINGATCAWSDPQRQNDTNYTCPNNGVMVARDHQGDENGNTRYYCCAMQTGTCG